MWQRSEPGRFRLELELEPAELELLERFAVEERREVKISLDRVLALGTEELERILWRRRELELAKVKNTA